MDASHRRTDAFVPGVAVDIPDKPGAISPSCIEPSSARELWVVPLAVNLDRIEFAVLAEQSGINRVPIVATFDHRGEAVGDLRREFTEAEDRCRRRGLLDRAGRVSDDVRDLLGIYPRTSVEFDLRFSAEKGHELRATVSRSGRDAVRTVVEGGGIQVEEVFAESAITSLVSVLPEQAPARIRPVGIDLAALQDVMAEQPDGTADAVESALRSRGVDTRDYRRVTHLLDGPRFGAGQLGASVWDGARREHRGERTVQVVDVTSGRLAIYDSSGRRMVVGADAGTFDRVLGELAEDTHRAW